MPHIVSAQLLCGLFPPPALVLLTLLAGNGMNQPKSIF